MKPYRPGIEGIREWNPYARRSGPIMLTVRVTPSVRTVKGWLFPLEYYDENLKLDVLQQYTELLFLMGSAKNIDFDSIIDIMREAKNRLNDDEYERLLTYKSRLERARSGIPAEIR